MKDGGVPDSEMVNFPWQNRPDASAVEALLSGKTEPGYAPGGLRPVAQLLTALQAPPDSGEVAGWHKALAVFREAPEVPEPSARARSRRPTRLGGRLAVAAAAAAVAALGGGFAAYTGSLPASLQKIAHVIIAAPGVSPARPAPPSASHPASPRAQGDAHGLCNAYLHGNPSQRAVAFRRLVKAAGGESNVASHCGSVPRPGTAHRAKPTPTTTTAPSSASHGQGRLKAHPTHPGKPSATPSHGKNA